MIRGSGAAPSYLSGVGSGLVYAAVGLVWAWYAASRVASARAGRRTDQESSARARVIRRAVETDSLDGADETAVGTVEVSTVVRAAATSVPATTEGPTGRRSRLGRRRTSVPPGSGVDDAFGASTDGAVPVQAVPAGAFTASPAPMPRTISRAARRAAVRRRRVVLALLVAASLGLGASAALGYLPIWAAAPAPLLCLGFVVAGARAVRRSTRSAVAPVHAVVAAEADDPSWAGVPFVDVVADWCRTVPGHAPETAEVEAPGAAAADGVAERFEAARLRSASTPAVEAAGSRAGSWRAVPVPLPTYVTAPRIARTVKTIDLGSTGAWTSGRSAPSPLALPVAGTGLARGATQVGAEDVEQASIDVGAVPDGAAAGSGADADENTEAIDFPRAATA